MILKIEKPLCTSDDVPLYLIYNKCNTIVINDVQVGQSIDLDNMFNQNETKIFIEGYIDKKDRLVIKRKVEQQNW